MFSTSSRPDTPAFPSDELPSDTTGGFDGARFASMSFPTPDSRSDAKRSDSRLPGATGGSDPSRLVEEFLAGWNAHDIPRVAALHAEEFEGVDVGRPGSYRGPKGISQLMSDSLEAFPDLCLTRDGVVIEGDRAVLVWTARGTHKGRLMRIPPTGREICVRGVSVLTVGEAGITHGLYVWDTAGLLRGIGLLPEL